MTKIIGNDYILHTSTVRLVAIEDEKIVYWSYDNGKYDWLHPSNIERLNDIELTENKKEAKPLYTKQMKEAGELPSVGMECMVLNSNMFKPEWELCTILFMGKFKVVYDSASAKERMADVDTTGEIKFKPIDTRTDKEIFRDDMRALNWVTYGELFDAIESGNIHGVTFTGSK